MADTSPLRLVTLRDVIDGLERIGDPDKIAERLVKLGINGTRESSCYCPIADYANRCIPHARVIITATWCIDNRPSGEKFCTPPAVRQFVQLFDLGHYPALETQPI